MSPELYWSIGGQSSCRCVWAEAYFRGAGLNIVVLRPQNCSHQPCHSPFYPCLSSTTDTLHGLFFTPTGYFQPCVGCGHVPFFVPSSLCVPKRPMLISAGPHAWPRLLLFQQICAAGWSPAFVSTCVRAHVCLQKERFLCIVRRTDAAVCCPCTSLVISVPNSWLWARLHCVSFPSHSSVFNLRWAFVGQFV